jgi:hypothetical protein
MKDLWTYMRRDLTRDDLFLRLIFLVIGCMLAVIGILMAAFGLFASKEQLWARMLAGPLGVAFVAWGVLVALRCFVAARSRIAAAAEKWFPDPAGIEDAVVLLLLPALPVVLLTLALHALGVRGQARAARDEAIKGQPGSSL